jgi:integrase
LPDPDALRHPLPSSRQADTHKLRTSLRSAAPRIEPPGSSSRRYRATDLTLRPGRPDIEASVRDVAEIGYRSLYVADLKRRGRRPATIARKLAAIAVYRRSMDHPTPTAHDVVRAVVRSSRRQMGVAQPRKTALELDALRSVVLAIPDDLRGLRDRALLLIGWAATLRRSELVALEVADLGFEPEGVVLTIRRSKTDREGAGVTVTVPFGGEEATCPVGALRRWLAAAAIAEGRVFRRIDRRRPRAPGARRPRSCATGAGRACRSPAANPEGARWDDNPAAPPRFANDRGARIGAPRADQ